MHTWVVFNPRFKGEINACIYFVTTTYVIESNTHSVGAMYPHIHLGGDHFIVLYYGNDFKLFHLFYYYIFDPDGLIHHDHGDMVTCGLPK